MNLPEPYSELLGDNPKATPERVAGYLDYLAQLEAAGVHTKPQYGITPPFFGKRPGLVEQRPCTMNVVK